MASAAAADLARPVRPVRLPWGRPAYTHSRRAILGLPHLRTGWRRGGCHPGARTAQADAGILLLCLRRDAGPLVSQPVVDRPGRRDGSGSSPDADSANPVGGRPARRTARDAAPQAAAGSDAR